MTVKELMEELTYYDEDAEVEFELTVEKLKRPKGEWIHKPLVYGVTYCSECDFELKINNTNYCPNCGAKMTESEEKE